METITNEAPVAKVKATRKPAKVTKAKVVEITGTQHRVLVALKNKKTRLTRKQISEKAFNGNSINFVPILSPLVKAKLLDQHDIEVDGRAETLFEATAAGRKVGQGPAPVTARGGANHQTLPKAGGTITKTYLGKEVKVKVNAGGTFTVGGKTYSSLTAAAKAVRKSDQEVNGWAFFGLVKNGDN